MRRASIQALPTIDRTCARVAGVLEQPGQDQVTLLRVARVLKGASRDLALASHRSFASGESNRATVLVDLMLRDIERRLRCVLLSSPPPDLRTMHSHLVRALDEAMDVLAVLNGSS